jgi:hypothetical protein
MPKNVVARTFFWLKDKYAKVKALRAWIGSGYEPPAPHFIKQSILLRHGIPGSVWVETGTHYGSTTKVLSKAFAGVHTIEPSQELYNEASDELEKLNNVFRYLGTSEAHFASILNRLSGDVCFWLDGHFSGANTYQGAKDTPIRHELEALKSRLPELGPVVVFIDDIRLSHTQLIDYPSLDFYVDWSRSCDLNWLIENDIFIAKSRVLPAYP